MTNPKFKFVVVTLFAISLTLNSCGNKTNDSTNTQQTEQKGKEYTSAYVCPMHCEGSGSDTAGKCPVCGMDYVMNENHKSDEHHQDTHKGHNH